MPKKDLHPKWYPDATIKVNGEIIMTVGSTAPEMNVEIWSGTHPFYTGQQRLVDTEGQVDRFMRRLQKRQEYKAAQDALAAAEAPKNPNDVLTDMLPLSSRAIKAMKEDGLNTAADIMSRLQADGDDGLLAIVGVGQKALIDTKKYLRAEGMIE